MIEIILIAWATVFDALRDRYYPKLANAWPRWTREQWRWHIFKWLAFYPPLVYIVWSFHIYEKFLLAMICFFIWRFVYEAWRTRREFIFFSRSTDALPSAHEPKEL